MALRTVLAGDAERRSQRALDLFLVGSLLVVTFGAYALGLFGVDGGVIFLPEDATLVGFVAAAGIGARRGALVLAWLAQFAAYLGFRADWAFLGLSGRSLGEQITYFFDPDGLGVLAVAALVVGTLGFGVGRFGRWGVERLGNDTAGPAP